MENPDQEELSEVFIKKTRRTFEGSRSCKTLFEERVSSSLGKKALSSSFNFLLI